MREISISPCRTERIRTTCCVVSIILSISCEIVFHMCLVEEMPNIWSFNQGYILGWALNCSTNMILKFCIKCKQHKVCPMPLHFFTGEIQEDGIKYMLGLGFLLLLYQLEKTCSLQSWEGFYWSYLQSLRHSWISLNILPISVFFKMGKAQKKYSSRFYYPGCCAIMHQ